MSSSDDLRNELQRIGRILERSDDVLAQRNHPVSGWSASEHLDHTLKVATSILKVIREPKDEVLKPFNLVGRIVLALGYIPRGRGKSPKSLVGTPARAEQLRSAAAEVNALLAAMPADRMKGDRRVVMHPYFGGLNPARALRFAVIHTRHHLKIVDDVLRHR